MSRIWLLLLAVQATMQVFMLTTSSRNWNASTLAKSLKPLNSLFTTYLMKMVVWFAFLKVVKLLMSDTAYNLPKKRDYSLLVLSILLVVKLLPLLTVVFTFTAEEKLLLPPLNPSHPNVYLSLWLLPGFPVSRKNKIKLTYKTESVLYSSNLYVLFLPMLVSPFTKLKNKSNLLPNILPHMTTLLSWVRDLVLPSLKKVL